MSYNLRPVKDLRPRKTNTIFYQMGRGNDNLKPIPWMSCETTVDCLASSYRVDMDQYTQDRVVILPHQLERCGKISWNVVLK